MGQPPARRAEREAHGEFMAASRCAREEQIRDIRRRHEQHQRNDNHDDEKRLSISAAHRRRTASRRLDAERRRQIAPPHLGADIVRHRGFADLRLGGAQGLLGLSRCPAILQTRHYQQRRRRHPIEHAIAAANQWFGPDRQDHVGHAPDIGPEEIWRRHADDRERHAIDRLHFADRVRHSTEPPLPQTVADDGHRPVRPATAPIILGGERSPE